MMMRKRWLGDIEVSSVDGLLGQPRLVVAPWLVALRQSHSSLSVSTIVTQLSSPFEMIRSHHAEVPGLQAPPCRPCRHRCHTVAPPASVRPARFPLTCMQLRTWLRSNYLAVAFRWSSAVCIVTPLAAGVVLRIVQQLAMCRRRPIGFGGCVAASSM